MGYSSEVEQWKLSHTHVFVSDDENATAFEIFFKCLDQFTENLRLLCGRSKHSGSKQDDRRSHTVLQRNEGPKIGVG
ncbi:MAG: hypothetical protein RL743_1031 [Actinomycetota bacterium]